MEKIINDACENRAKIDGNSDKSILDAITTTIEKVDKGEIVPTLEEKDIFDVIGKEYVEPQDRK